MVAEKLTMEEVNTCDCVGDDVERRPPPKDPPPPPKPPPAREIYTVCTGRLLFVLTKLKRNVSNQIFYSNIHTWF